MQTRELVRRSTFASQDHTPAGTRIYGVGLGERGPHRHSGPTARPPRARPFAMVRRCAFGVRIEALRPLPPGSLPDKPATMPLKCRKADCQSR